MMLFLAEDDLVIKDQIHLENGLAVVIAVCLLLAVVLVALVVWLARPSRKPAKIVNRGRHDALAGKTVWHQRIDDVVSAMPGGSWSARRLSHSWPQSPGILLPLPPERTCATRRSPTSKRRLGPRGTSRVSPCSGKPSRHCIRRNSRMPSAITSPGRPRSSRLANGWPILWKGGDRCNCHGIGLGSFWQASSWCWPLPASRCWWPRATKPMTSRVPHLQPG